MNLKLLAIEELCPVRTNVAPFKSSNPINLVTNPTGLSGIDLTTPIVSYLSASPVISRCKTPPEPPTPPIPALVLKTLLFEVII